ncbi:MAG: ATP-binding protein [Gemmatimonadota bacterium]|nr:ATP-binding protein [Gemmatimonadota bacterium]
MTVMPPTPIFVSWSSGKDSAWALHVLRQQPETWDVRGIFTTVTTAFDRVSVHGTPRWALEQQARRLRLPIYEIEIPYPCSNDAYDTAMHGFLARARGLPEVRTASHLAFGDLFLEDVRAYREDRLAKTGFTPVFPIWGSDTTRLAHTMIDSGLRAVVNAVDPELAPAEIAGRWFDRKLLADLPPQVDPLGENGEFHTCVLDGPMFSSSVPARPGTVVRRPVAADPDGGPDGRECVYADLVRA